MNECLLFATATGIADSDKLWEIMKYLLDRSIEPTLSDINFKRRKKQQLGRVANLCITSGNLDLFDRLFAFTPNNIIGFMDNQYEVPSFDGNEQSALEYCIEQNNLEYVKFLIEKCQASANVKRGVAFLLCIEFDRADIFKYLSMHCEGPLNPEMNFLNLFLDAIEDFVGDTLFFGLRKLKVGSKMKEIFDWGIGNNSNEFVKWVHDPNRIIYPFFLSYERNETNRRALFAISALRSIVYLGEDALKLKQLQEVEANKEDQKIKKRKISE
jgi:hypothetical protein